MVLFIANSVENVLLSFVHFSQRKLFEELAFFSFRSLFTSFFSFLALHIVCVIVFGVAYARRVEKK